MFFRKNNRDMDENFKAESGTALLEYFSSTDPDEIDRMVGEISPETKNFFEGSIGSLIGQMPDEIAETDFKITRDNLKHLLMSSMVTGYLSKSVEDKIYLESLYN